MADPWPSLPLEDWKDTYATLHPWTQIVGKIRLAPSPWINHSWGVTLYVTARGLTTSPEVRRAAAPDAMLPEFLQSTYEAAAELGRWDRAALERA